jgi:hypothetical protein
MPEGQPTPQYILKPEVKRAVVPQLILVTILSIVFFIGIVINLKLLKYKTTPTLYILVALVLIALSALQILLTYGKVSRTEYMFYLDRIIEEKTQKTIMLKDVADISSKTGFWDKRFGTGDIILDPGFRIEGVENSNQIFFYIQKLVQNAKAYTQYQQPQ